MKVVAAVVAVNVVSEEDHGKERRRGIAELHDVG